MSYQTEFTDVADMEVQNILLWLIGKAPERVDSWQQGLEDAVASLSEMPSRCPLAPENTAFLMPVRQRLYGAYRILFTLVDVDGDGSNDTVRILHVRHGAQRYMGEDDEAP